MITEIQEIARDFGYDVGELMAHANLRKPTDPSHLSGIERAFKKCELHGKQLLKHQGKLLVMAQDIFYANHPKGRADQLYGHWQRDNLGINPKQAQRLVRYYRYCSDQLTGGHACPPLPSLKTVLAVTAENVPVGVRDQITEKMKRGEPVTEAMVREAVQRHHPDISTAVKPDREPNKAAPALSVEEVFATLPRSHQKILNQHMADVTAAIEAKNLKERAELAASIRDERLEIDALRTKLQNARNLVWLPFSREEFQFIRGMLHPDRHPDQQERANKAFLLFGRIESVCQKAKAPKRAAR